MRAWRRDELQQLAVSTNHEVRENAKACDRRVGRMHGSIETVREHSTMPGPPELPGGSEMPWMTASVIGVPAVARRNSAIRCSARLAQDLHNRSSATARRATLVELLVIIESGVSSASIRPTPVAAFAILAQGSSM